MLHLLKQCCGGGVRFQRYSCLVKDWALPPRLQGSQLRSLMQTPRNRCNLEQKFKLNLQAPEQKDQLMYVNQSGRYYKLMNLFAISQFGFWLIVGYSLLDLKKVEVPKEKKQDETLPWWRKYDFSYYKYPMGIAAYAIAFVVLAGCWLHTLRAVQHVVLRKGGQTVTIGTHTPFGSIRQYTLPLERVSAVSGRIGTPSSYLTLKIKGHLMHFLVETDGNFVRPALYEKTVGVRRNFAAPRNA